VTIADEDDHQRTVTIVGNDEADASAGRIGWDAPLARALRGAGGGGSASGDTARRRKRV
jgi:transcription elongation factor GreB